MKALSSTAASVLAGVIGFAPFAQATEAHSMIGCLGKGAEDGAFVLTHVEGAIPMVAIAESTADLGPHVGHKVEITGMAVTGKDPKEHTMKVTAMKHIDAACP